MEAQNTPTDTGVRTIIDAQWPDYGHHTLLDHGPTLHDSGGILYAAPAGHVYAIVSSGTTRTILLVRYA